MKKIFYFLLLTMIIALPACSMPLAPSVTLTPTTDAVATQVSLLLTAQPSATQPEMPTTAATGTLPPLKTSTPTIEPSATLAPSATPTLNPNDPRATYGNPSWSDTLESAKNFYLYENDNTKIDSTPGAIVLTGKNANGWIGWTLTYSQNPTNFYLEATFKTGDCAGSDLYGMVFRASKDNTGYYFGVTCDGQYNLHGRDFNNNEDAEIIPFKQAGAIHSGANQTNRLGILAQGDKIRLYANGTLLEEVTDSAYSSGYFGPFIAAYHTANFTVNMDEIDLWKLN
jgi:hypothetical protein